VLGLSLARPAVLGEVLGDLDPALPLDWNGVSFQGLPALRGHVRARAGRLLAALYRTCLLPGSACDCPAPIRLGVGGGAEVKLHIGLQRRSQVLADWT